MSEQQQGRRWGDLSRDERAQEVQRKWGKTSDPGTRRILNAIVEYGFGWLRAVDHVNQQDRQSGQGGGE